MMNENKTVVSLVYTVEEWRSIRTVVDKTRLALTNFIEQYKHVDRIDVEFCLLNRCVYKNWNARRAEPGIQSCRRTARLCERFIKQRIVNLDDILQTFQPDQIVIRLPSRGTLNQLKMKVNESKLMLTEIRRSSRLTVDHLRRECARSNYVQYNILIMSLCSRLYYLSGVLEKAQDEFVGILNDSMKSFKKKTNKLN